MITSGIGCLPDMARVWAGKTPNKAALIDSGRVVSYTQLNERSNRVANELARTGIRPGYHVGFLGKDSSAFFDIWLGVNKAGCALTSLSLRSAPAELVEVVQDANIPLIFAGRDFAEFAERVRQAADITMEIVAEDELDHWSSDAGVADHDVVLTDGDTALLGYTSGTTAPKGVPISHGALMRWFDAAAAERSVSWNSDDIGLMVMPNFHLAGTLVSLSALYHGASLAILSAFDPTAFVAAIAALRQPPNIHGERTNTSPASAAGRSQPFASTILSSTPGMGWPQDFSRSGLGRRRSGLLAVAGRQLHHRNLYPGRRWCAERQAGMVGTASRAPQRTELGDGSLGPFTRQVNKPKDKPMTDDRTTDLPAPKELDASTALIVGGTAGIGLASARALAAAGVPRIVIVGRNAERGQLAAKSIAELGAAAHFVTGDATDPSGAAAVTAEADEILSGIDILMCSTAADVRPELFIDIPTAEIGRMLTQLALPSMQMASAVLPGMRSRRSGVIVNVASDAAKTATPGEAVIGSAKAAIVMFTRTIAIEEKRYGIRANALTPSLVHGTASTERITADGFSGKLFARAAQQAQLGVPTADDIAALTVFLCGPAAARLTGQAISVNGGISAA